MPLTRPQIRAFATKVRPMLAWFHRACRRLERRGDDVSDRKLYNLTADVHQALHKLSTHLQGQSVDGTGERNERIPLNVADRVKDEKPPGWQDRIGETTKRDDVD